MAGFDWIASDFIRHEKALGEVNNLIKQLSPNEKPLTMDGAIYLAEQDKSLWRGFFDGDGRLRGMATMTSRCKPTGVALYLDDLIVDESLPERGVVGRVLIRQLIEEAQHECPLPIKVVDWSCGLGPERIRANRFYEKFGAEKRPTNHYTYRIAS